MNLNELHVRDPFILPANGRYYLYVMCGGEPGVDVYASDDLERLEGPINAFRPTGGFWGCEDFWGPETHFYDGAYYLFVAIRGASRIRGVGILKSDSPEGPFRDWSGGPATPKDWMCLDGTLYVDKKGDPWMVFCHEWIQMPDRDGTVCAVRMSGDLRRAFGEPIVLFKGSDAPWCRADAFDYIDGWVTDACFMHRMASGTLLMLWSTFGKNGYCVGYAVSQGGDIDGPWVQEGELLFDENGGSARIFKTFGGELKLVLHHPNLPKQERVALFTVEERGDKIRIV